MKTISGFFTAIAFILVTWSSSYSQVITPDSAASVKRNNAKLDTMQLKKVPYDTVNKTDSLNRINIKNPQNPETDTVIPPKNIPLYEIKAGKKVPLRDSIQ